MFSMDAKLYNTSGKEAGKVKLPERVFNVDWNADLVHQVVTAMQANARNPIAHTKFRSEVSGTGKKPWKQKGTGSARHGSRRSPIWRTGGIAHGPRSERDYTQKINKKMRTKALYTVLSKKLKYGEVLFVDQMAFEAPKAKEAKNAIAGLASIEGFSALKTKRKNTAYFALAGTHTATMKSFRNFGNVVVDDIRNLNPVTALQYKYVVIVGGDDAVLKLAQRDVTTKKAE